jgi:hypothetical protein
VKAGDAKLWVYSHNSDHDRQAAEDHNILLCLFGLAVKSQVFFIGWLDRFSETEKPHSLVQTQRKLDMQRGESHVP